MQHGGSVHFKVSDFGFEVLDFVQFPLPIDVEYVKSNYTVTPRGPSSMTDLRSFSICFVMRAFKWERYRSGMNSIRPFNARMRSADSSTRLRSAALFRAAARMVLNAFSTRGVVCENSIRSLPASNALRKSSGVRPTVVTAP